MMVTKEMQKILLMAFLLGIFIGACCVPVLTVNNSNYNGPFIIVPGAGSDDISNSRVCGVGVEGNKLNTCCAWGEIRADECAKEGGEYCQVINYYDHTCEYKPKH